MRPLLTLQARPRREFAARRVRVALDPPIVLAMHVHVVDPSAYTPPYDHALSAALAAQGAEVELFTSRFAYGAAWRRAGLSPPRLLLPARVARSGRARPGAH